jgi:hypothetical protein
MSSEMVACIAVESISILESMHSKGNGLSQGWLMPILNESGFLSLRFDASAFFFSGMDMEMSNLRTFFSVRLQLKKRSTAMAKCSSQSRGCTGPR